MIGVFGYDQSELQLLAAFCQCRYADLQFNRASYTLPWVEERSIVMTMLVCMYVRLCTCIYFTTFLCMLPIAMAQSSFGGVAVRYATSNFVEDDVTSCFHIMDQWQRYCSVVHRIMPLLCGIVSVASCHRQQ